MSKRFIFSEYNNDKKRPKLDISISDHNFPLSQNKENNKDIDQAWGDENDDEMLLLASQACEEDISILPEYNLCMRPGSTSTQEPAPSTSRAEFTFKKPSLSSPRTLSTSLRQKCTTISSPLPGLTNQVMKQTHEVNLSDDLILNDKNYKAQDSNYVYRQLLQLQEENAKLKSENGKLLEKCVTKEGEASILRTQLKSCQVAVDNAKLDKIKAQERVQMEWMEKLTAANSQLNDLRTQVEFKNLEIISVKEKCKKLESTKVKMTQVTVGRSDMTTSHRYGYPNDSFATQSKHVKTSTNAVQTDSMAHFLDLHMAYSTASSSPPELLPYILESTADHPSLLHYNEKLQQRTDSIQKCAVFSSFHQVAGPPAGERRGRVTLDAYSEDLTAIATGRSDVDLYYKIFNAVHLSLLEVKEQLEVISQRMTSAFQKEMDEKYIEGTLTYLRVENEDLLRGRALYKEEQAIVSRRLTAVLARVLETTRGAEVFANYLRRGDNTSRVVVDTIGRICTLLDTTCCASVYSGLLLSITWLTNGLTHIPRLRAKLLEMVKAMISSRPMSFVAPRLLEVLRGMSRWKRFPAGLCPGNGDGNLKLDYEQGVFLYKNDSCSIQVLLKQVEACLKSIESQALAEQAVTLTRQLMMLHTNILPARPTDRHRCECDQVLIQVVVFALRVCAGMLHQAAECGEASLHQELAAVARCGVLVLYRRVLGDAEFSSQLAHCEGHLVQFCDTLRGLQHDDIYANMVSELSAALQSTPEEMPASFHSEPWLNSFRSFFTH